MRLKKRPHDGVPYAIEAKSEDGSLTAIFGDSANVTEWFPRDGNPAPSGEYVGSYNGRPVMVSPSDYQTLRHRHGLA